MFFSLRDTKRSFKFPLIGSTLRLVCSLSARTVRPFTHLPVDHQHSQVWYVIAWPPQPLGTHRPALLLSFRTTTLTYCLPPFYGRELLSVPESTLVQACIDEPIAWRQFIGNLPLGVLPHLSLMGAMSPNS